MEAGPQRLVLFYIRVLGLFLSTSLKVNLMQATNNFELQRHEIVMKLACFYNCSRLLHSQDRFLIANFYNLITTVKNF